MAHAIVRELESEDRLVELAVQLVHAHFDDLVAAPDSSLTSFVKAWPDRLHPVLEFLERLVLWPDCVLVR